jgi:predicted dehydrogenase
VNVGVIGYGYWGPKLVRNLAALPQCRLTWVADRDPAVRARIRAEHPEVRVTADSDELLASEVDAVVIATPIRTHHALAHAALLAGKHVMVEKPLTTSSAEAIHLDLLANALGLTLMVGHTFQYNAAVLALRDVVASGELGEIRSVAAARLNLGLCQPDLNVIWDLAPHDLSILDTVLPHAPVAISARGTWSVTPGVEDVAYVELLYPSGSIAHLHLSWLDPVKVRRVTVIGSRKTAVYDDTDPTAKLRIYDKGVDRREPAAGLPAGDGRGQLTYRDGGVTIPPVAEYEPLRAQCEHFLACARSGVRPFSDAGAGTRVVHLIEQAQLSLRNSGRWQRLTRDPLLVEPDGATDALLGRRHGVQPNGHGSHSSNGSNGSNGAHGVGGLFPAAGHSPASRNGHHSAAAGANQFGLGAETVASLTGATRGQ